MNFRSFVLLFYSSSYIRFTTRIFVDIETIWIYLNVCHYFIIAFLIIIFFCYSYNILESKVKISIKNIKSNHFSPNLIFAKTKVLVLNQSVSAYRCTMVKCINTVWCVYTLQTCIYTPVLIIIVSPTRHAFVGGATCGTMLCFNVCCMTVIVLVIAWRVASCCALMYAVWQSLCLLLHDVQGLA